MVNFPIRISGCDSHSPLFLDLFLSSDIVVLQCFCSDHPFKNSDVVVPVSIEFWSNSKGNVPIHNTPYDYSYADWYSFCDHLRDAPWKNIFKLLNLVLVLLLLNNVSSSRLELMYISHVASVKSSLVHLHGY